MKHHRLAIVIVAIVLAALAIGATQSAPHSGQRYTTQERAYLEEYAMLNMDQSVAKAWVDVCGRNKSLYADLDKVQPGDTILLPLGYGPYVAQEGGRDCMWRAAEYYVMNVVLPYYGRPVPGSALERVPDTVKTTDTVLITVQSSASKWPWVLLASLLTAVGLYLWWLSRQLSRRFVANPPDFRTSTDAQISGAAEPALHRALGRNFQIVGNIERGTANGEFLTYFPDGSSRREVFYNEPAFRARVRFNNGQERLIVCRWACFNPCWSATDAQFRGTFLPQDATHADVIPMITREQQSAVERSICGGEGNLSAADLPETDSVELPTSTVASKPTAGKMRLTKLRITEGKGVEMEGDFEITVKQIHDMLFQIFGRRPEDGKAPKGKEKPASPQA